MFHLPEPLTAQSLSALMKDRRYRDRRDPENKAYRDFVTRAYRSYYSDASQAGRVTGGIVHVRPYDRVVKGQVQHVQAYERHGPWSDRPDVKFRQGLAMAETSAIKPDDGYGDFHANREERKLDTLGRYQIQREMLKKAGWLDESYKWSEKTREHGVTTDAEFLQNPEAQEAALDDVLPLYEKEAESRGFFERARRGDKIAGKRGEITVTEAGVIAAMHREGGPNTARYFAEVDRAKRERRRIRYDKKGVFEHIETRLRIFQNVPYTRRTPPGSQPQRKQ